SGALRVDTRIIDLLLQCCDHLHAQLGLLESGGSTEDAAHAPAGGQLVHALQSLGNPVPEGESHDTWHISVPFGPDMLRAGMDPPPFLQSLRRLGEIPRLTTPLMPCRKSNASKHIAATWASTSPCARAPT